MSNLVEHAKRELQAVGYSVDSPPDDANGWVTQNILELIRVFADQGHSGFSASYVVSAFEKLASFEPLCPLTGDESEWVEVADGIYQNARCSRVFRENGEAYDINGKVFREKDGGSFTSIDSRVPVEFPYTPKTEYVDA